MPKLAPKRPSGKGAKKVEGKRSTGWRSVGREGLPERREFPVLVVPREGLPFVATGSVNAGELWVIDISSMGARWSHAHWAAVQALERALACKSWRIAREAALELKRPAQQTERRLCAESDWWLPVDRLRLMVRFARVPGQRESA